MNLFRTFVVFSYCMFTVFRSIRRLLCKISSKYKHMVGSSGVVTIEFLDVWPRNCFSLFISITWIFFFAEHACVKFRLKQTYLHDHQIWRTVQTNKQSFTEKITQPCQKNTIGRIQVFQDLPNVTYWCNTPINSKVNRH